MVDPCGWAVHAASCGWTKGLCGQRRSPPLPFLTVSTDKDTETVGTPNLPDARDEPVSFGAEVHTLGFRFASSAASEGPLFYQTRLSTARMPTGRRLRRERNPGIRVQSRTWRLCVSSPLVDRFG